MNHRLRMCAKLVAAAALLVPSCALAVDAAAVDACHQAIVRGLAAIEHARDGQIARCLKGDNYDACVLDDLHTVGHENEFRNHVVNAASECQAALDSGASVADFGPGACASEWANCDTEFPSIATLSDIAECLICEERGYDLEMRSIYGLPRPAPTDPDERRCTKVIEAFVQTTIHKAIIDLSSCAKGKTKPFSCPVDPTTDSKFGAALASFATRIARCGIDEGKAPGALANLCGGTATDSASLTECFRSLAKCIACRTANTALDQSDDCAAFSGNADCDGMF